MNTRYIKLGIIVVLVIAVLYQVFNVYNPIDAIFTGINVGSSVYLVMFKFLPDVMGDKE